MNWGCSNMASATLWNRNAVDTSKPYNTVSFKRQQKLSENVLPKITYLR